jgi:histidyl-tRNA synthetase
VIFDGIGAQTALAGGGRYAITPPGGSRPLEGVGFAAGFERLLLARESLGLPIAEAPSIDVYLVGLGEAALRRNLLLARELRGAGFRLQMDLEGRGMKAQMKAANKSGAARVLILGDDELARNVATLKDMASGEQKDVSLDSLAAALR